MSEQPRRPAGSPQGGEYAPLARSESPVELTDDDKGLGWEGSFHAAPTCFTTAEQVCGFFAQHPPPDATVFRLRRLLTARRKAQIDELWRADLRSRLAAWDAQNPVPNAMTKRRQAELDAEHANRREAFTRALRAQMAEDERYRYHVPSAYASFQAAQALGRWSAASRLPAAERERIERMDTGWSYPDGSMIDHRDLIGEQGLGEIADQVMDPEAEHNEMMDLLEDIQRVQGLAAQSAHQANVAAQEMAYYSD